MKNGSEHYLLRQSLEGNLDQERVRDVISKLEHEDCRILEQAEVRGKDLYNLYIWAAAGRIPWLRMILWAYRDGLITIDELRAGYIYDPVIKRRFRDTIQAILEIYSGKDCSSYWC